MSSGLWHNRATVASTTICTILALPYEPKVAICIAIGGLSAIFLTPDLDQPTLNRTENQLVRNSSLIMRFIGYMYVGFFSPYAYMFKHRSFWTHQPIIGTLGRLLYIALALCIIRLAALPIDGLVYMWQNDLINWHYVMVGLIMLAINDTIHWIMDFIIQFK